MRRFLLTLIFLILGACTTTPTAEPSPEVTEAQTYRIALVMKTLTNPFFIEMERGAREAEAELGIDLIVRTAAQETSIEQQIEIIEELTQEGVDAIVIAPGDSIALIPSLKAAQDSGIVIINIDNRLDPQASETAGLVGVPFISVDNEAGAYLAVQYLITDVTEAAEAIIFEGIRDAQNAQDRRAGAERAFAENENITVVASETANWQIEEAYSLAASLFEQHPNATLVFAANDMMALGVIQYLSEAGRSDVRVAGFDALTEAQSAIEAGTMVVTIDQQAALQGYTGIIFAVRALNGEDLPAETMVDVLLVNSDSMAGE